MTHKRLNKAFAQAAADAGESALHAGVTIAARWPILAAGMVAPTAASVAEWNEAYTEKVEAAWQGMFAASAAFGLAMGRAAFRPPTPAALAHDMVRIAGIAARPARRKVKANAKRFGAAR